MLILGLFFLSLFLFHLRKSTILKVNPSLIIARWCRRRSAAFWWRFPPERGRLVASVAARARIWAALASAFAATEPEPPGWEWKVRASYILCKYLQHTWGVLVPPDQVGTDGKMPQRETLWLRQRSSWVRAELVFRRRAHRRLLLESSRAAL